MAWLRINKPNKTETLYCMEREVTHEWVDGQVSFYLAAYEPMAYEAWEGLCSFLGAVTIEELGAYRAKAKRKLEEAIERRSAYEGEGTTTSTDHAVDKMVADAVSPYQIKETTKQNQR